MLAKADRLTVQFQLADAAAQARAKDVIDRHLVRFAFREGGETMA